MANTIWKFPIYAGDFVELALPVGAKILTIAMQHDEVQAWVQLDPQKGDYTTRRIYVVPTGGTIPDDATEYISTVLIHGGNLVFHFFASAEQS